MYPFSAVFFYFLSPSLHLNNTNLLYICWPWDDFIFINILNTFQSLEAAARRLVNNTVASGVPLFRSRFKSLWKLFSMTSSGNVFDHWLLNLWTESYFRKEDSRTELIISDFFHSESCLISFIFSRSLTDVVIMTPTARRLLHLFFCNYVLVQMMSLLGCITAPVSPVWSWDQIAVCLEFHKFSQCLCMGMIVCLIPC